jgi:hypothetical protein
VISRWRRFFRWKQQGVEKHPRPKVEPVFNGVAVAAKDKPVLLAAINRQRKTAHEHYTQRIWAMYSLGRFFALTGHVLEPRRPILPRDLQLNGPRLPLVRITPDFLKTLKTAHEHYTQRIWGISSEARGGARTAAPVQAARRTFVRLLGHGITTCGIIIG